MSNLAVKVLVDLLHAPTGSLPEISQKVKDALTSAGYMTVFQVRDWLVQTPPAKVAGIGSPRREDIRQSLIKLSLWYGTNGSVLTSTLDFIATESYNAGYVARDAKEREKQLQRNLEFEALEITSIKDFKDAATVALLKKDPYIVIAVRAQCHVRGLGLVVKGVKLLVETKDAAKFGLCWNPHQHEGMMVESVIDLEGEGPRRCFIKFNPAGGTGTIKFDGPADAEAALRLREIRKRLGDPTIGNMSASSDETSSAPYGDSVAATADIFGDRASYQSTE